MTMFQDWKGGSVLLITEKQLVDTKKQKLTLISIIIALVAI